MKSLLLIALLALGQLIPLTTATAQQQEPLIIAHRGASAYAPEHSSVAVALAHAMDADYIEQDIVLTRDKVPVVLHDIQLDAVTNVAEVFPERTRPDGRYYVLDFSFAELQQLTLQARIDPNSGQVRYPRRFPAGYGQFRIMSLAEQLELIQGLNISRNELVGVYIEIKAARWHREQNYDITAAVMRVLHDYGYTGVVPPTPVYLQSFDPEVVRRLKREFHTRLPLVQLIGENRWNESPADYNVMRTAAGLEAVSSYADGVGVWGPQVLLGVNDEGQPQFSTLVTDAHKAGLFVHAYTLRADDLPAGVKNYAQLYEWLRQAGIDGVFTDFPDRHD
ncbi:glycerophosphodiester phosphodiesterase [Pseudidiomarina salinarum]|uniref:glycerophosphodiester phosphodiesterase n=1 Tax=Pseudidiomarina salinarum TaxID=435908 RepID=A0A094IX85_9GAMM|nr:glycerophosphodiester phosphodiesterase [Pseudidiomarina salinarum]